MISPFETVADGLAEQGFAIVDRFISLTEVADILKTDVFREGLLHFKRPDRLSTPEAAVRDPTNAPDRPECSH